MHGGQFNICTRDIIKVDTRATWSELTVHYLHVNSLNEMSANIMYGFSVNGLDVLSINVHPCDVRGLHGLSVTSLKILFVNICSHDVRDSVHVMSESGISGLNSIVP